MSGLQATLLNDDGFNVKFTSEDLFYLFHRQQRIERMQWAVSHSQKLYPTTSKNSVIEA